MADFIQQAKVPTTDEIERSVEATRIDAWRTAMVILRDHGALSSSEFAGRLYPTTPPWRGRDSVESAARLLGDLRKRGLVATYPPLRVTCITNAGRRFLADELARLMAAEAAGAKQEAS